MNTNIEKSVLKIENNKDLKLRIIQECRDYALKNFDIRMIARQWEKKIEETVYSKGKESAT
jgi:fructose/tagatose bisphosphate aldolase